MKYIVLFLFQQLFTLFSSLSSHQNLNFKDALQTAKLIFFNAHVNEPLFEQKKHKNEER